MSEDRMKAFKERIDLFVAHSHEQLRDLLHIYATGFCVGEIGGTTGRAWQQFSENLEQAAKYTALAAGQATAVSVDCDALARMFKWEREAHERGHA